MFFLKKCLFQRKLLSRKNSSRNVESNFVKFGEEIRWTYKNVTSKTEETVEAISPKNFFTDKLLVAMHNWNLTNLQKKNTRNVQKSFAQCPKRNVQLGYFFRKKKFSQFYLSKNRMQLWETCCNFSTERPNNFRQTPMVFISSKRLFQHTIFPKNFS